MATVVVQPLTLDRGKTRKRRIRFLVGLIVVPELEPIQWQIEYNFKLSQASCRCVHDSSAHFSRRVTVEYMSTVRE